MATSSIEHRSIVSVAKKVSSFRNLRSSSNSKKEEGRKLIYSSSKGKSYNEKDLVSQRRYEVEGHTLSIPRVQV